MSAEIVVAPSEELAAGCEPCNGLTKRAGPSFQVLVPRFDILTCGDFVTTGGGFCGSAISGTVGKLSVITGVSGTSVTIPSSSFPSSSSIIVGKTFGLVMTSLA